MSNLLERVTQIVSSHASMSSLSTEELIIEIQNVYSTLQALETGKEVAVPDVEEVKPSLTINNAFKKNEIICMLCGRSGMKTLTRHLGQQHAMKPGEYRKQFGINVNQPLTAKSYSDSRRKMAEEKGLAANLVKAREIRVAKLEAKKSAPVKKISSAKATTKAKAAQKTT